MAIISSYPTITPTSSDLVLIVDTSKDGNPTKTATISSVNALATDPDVQVLTKTLTKAEYQALQTTDATLVVAQGADKYIKILSITATFTPEVGGNQMSFVTLDVGTTKSAAGTKIQAQIPVSVSGVTTKTVYSMATIGSIIDANLPLIVGTQTAVTGDGTLQFNVRYQVI